VEALLNSLSDESQRLFIVGVVTAFILGIALVVVVFISQIRFLKNRLFEAKEIDISKNRKIADLQKEMKEIRIKDDALELELKQFNDTKIALQSKKELIFKMQERMNLLEEKEKEQLDTIEACSKEYQTLAFKYKSLQKRNVFLVEENSRFRTENTKILMKVREQERRIFEKLMSLQGNTAQQRSEIKKLAEGIFEKNRKLFEALRHETVMSQILPLNEEMLKFQREIVSTIRKNLGREGDMHNDIALKVESRQKFEERIETVLEKLKEENFLGRAGSNVAATTLKLLGIEKSEWVTVEHSEAEGKEEQIAGVRFKLPDGQSVKLDTAFSLLPYESYCQEIDRTKREESLKRFMEDFEKYVDGLSKATDGQGYHWMLIPDSEALRTLCRSEKRLCDSAAKNGILAIDASMLLAALESMVALWEYQRHYRMATELLSKAEAIQENFETYGEEISDVSQRLEMIQDSFSVDNYQ
jgi:DNA anti-recombination protein RmuC